MDYFSNDYGVCFSSLEFNVRNKSNELTKASRYYIGEAKDAIKNMISMYEDIGKESKSSRSLHLSNMHFMPEIRRVASYAINSNKSTITSSEVKETLNLLNLIVELLEEYENSTEPFFSVISEGKYQRLLAFSKFMNSLFVDNDRQNEKTLDSETKYFELAI